MTTRAVPVAGGSLAVELTEGTTEPVLAIHGVSSNRKLWNWLHAEAPEITILSPDLRGRGASVDVQGVSTVDQHVEDMLAVLDAFELDSAHVLGMSMGGFVACALAADHPGRVKTVTLIDGGPVMTPPPGATPENIEAAFADRSARLKVTFDSVEDFAALFTSTTGPLLDPADPLLLDYLAHDLVDGKVRLSPANLGSDARSIFFGPNRLADVKAPMRLAYAQWAIGDQTPGAYSHEMIDGLRELFVGVRYVEGVDHAGSIMTHTGGKVAGELLREALA